MLFIVLLAVVLLGVHSYLFRRLVRDLGASRGIQILTRVLFGLLALSVPGMFVVWTGSPRDGHGAFARFAFSWLGIAFYLVLVLGAWDVVRMATWAARRIASLRSGKAPRSEATAELLPATETRRIFLARTAATSAWVASAGLAGIGVRSALYDITTPEVGIALERFPRALDGYTIALMSDVHIGPLLDGRFLRDVVDKANRLRPDLVAIVGDLVDGSVPHIGAQVAELRRLRARDGVCFVTGNHEYYSGATQWVEFLRTLGIRVLMNERICLGDRGASFDLAGVPDAYAGRRGGIGPSAVHATRGRDLERELVMLAHQPAQIDDAASVHAGLQLSGHTHGGQLFPFGAVTALAQPYIAGLHRHGETQTQIYVSRGTGFWGPPMRVLAPAEITRLRLHST